MKHGSINMTQIVKFSLDSGQLLINVDPLIYTYNTMRWVKTILGTVFEDVILNEFLETGKTEFNYAF